VNCLLWNPQSLQNKTLDFIQLLDDNNVDIAFITESWMDSETNHTSALLKDAGYSMYHYFRPTKRGGGAAVIAKTAFVPKNGKSIPYKTFEVYIQSLKLFGNSAPLTLVTLYRLGKERNSDFIQEFYSFIEFLITNYTYFLICGDFNIHVNKPHENFVTDFFDILNVFSLSQSVHEPTHICGNTLDLIVHDPTVINICDIHVEKPDRSDHSIIFFKVKANLETKRNHTISFRNFKNVNLVSFKNDVVSQSNLFLSNCNNLDFVESLSMFNQIFGEIVNNHAPLVTKSVDSNPKPSWIDSEFRNARSERRRLYKRWKRTRTSGDRKKFEQSRLEVNNMSISKRKLYFSKCISDSGNSQRELFKICNSLLNAQKSKSLPESDDFNRLANTFNQYFVKKISNIRHELSTVCVNNCNVNRIINKLGDGIGGVACARSTLSNFSAVTIDQLKKIILSRKIKTSAWDVIPAQLLRSCLDEFLPVLSKLVNISLSTGSIQGLKDSVVTPLIKKQGLDPENMANYRPIANILYLSKVTEVCASLQIKTHMDLNNLHIPYQSGYKTAHSCESLLLSLTNDILKTMDSKKCTILLLLDLSAAFDTVDHDRLLNILFHEIGLRDIVYKWFISYLSQRRQAVNIKGHTSDFADIFHGVPQGSVLGPTLFNIYVRNFIRILNDAGFDAHGYADDHQVSKIFSIDFQYDAIRCSIPRCLDIIAYWMKVSFLKLNASKSQVIIFAPQTLASQVHIDAIKLRDGSFIPVSTLVTNLGVQFDSPLSFSPHINAICSQSYRLLRNLAGIRKFLTFNDLQILVQSIIVSRIDNCNSLLYGVLARHLNKLQKLQNACAKLIFGKKRNEHVTPLLHDLHWLPIRQRIVFKILLFVFKFYQNTAPLYIMESLSKSERNEFMLNVPRTSTHYGDRAFSSCGPRLWNALPLPIRASNTIGHFRSHLKHHLFTNFDSFLSTANLYID
jgi:hypothetical protein